MYMSYICHRDICNVHTCKHTHTSRHLEADEQSDAAEICIYCRFGSLQSDFKWDCVQSPFSESDFNSQSQRFDESLEKISRNLNA